MLRTFIALTLLLSAIASHAQRRDNPDATVLNRAKLVSQTDRVEVYRDDIDVEDGLAVAIDQLYVTIEDKLGRKFDTATLGKKIKVVVSNHVRVSHVWRGYQHMNDPLPVIFLNARAYNGFKSKANATLVHEMTHLFTWRYNSHSLREGVADYVARAVMPNTAVGPNDANAVSSPVGWAFKYLGSNHPAPSELTTDPEFRKNYYFSSYVLVKALIERTSMADFLRFYDGPYSDTLFESAFKVKRLDLICELKLGTDCKG
jgi:hypothetical protein